MGVEEGSGDVNTASKAGDKGGNREVTSKPLPFVNGPPEGCVWEQGGDLGVGEGMWEAEEGVSEIEVPKVVRLRQCLLFWREVINASPTVLSMAMSSPSWRSPHHEFVGATTQHMRMQNLCEIL